MFVCTLNISATVFLAPLLLHLTYRTQSVTERTSDDQRLGSLDDTILIAKLSKAVMGINYSKSTFRLNYNYFLNYLVVVKLSS